MADLLLHVNESVEITDEIDARQTRVTSGEGAVAVSEQVDPQNISPPADVVRLSVGDEVGLFDQVDGINTAGNVDNDSTVSITEDGVIAREIPVGFAGEQEIGISDQSQVQIHPTATTTRIASNSVIDVAEDIASLSSSVIRIAAGEEIAVAEDVAPTSLVRISVGEDIQVEDDFGYVSLQETITRISVSDGVGIAEDVPQPVPEEYLGFYERVERILRSTMYSEVVESSGIPTAWDNSIPCMRDDDDVWLRFMVRFGTSERLTLSSPGSGCAHTRHAGLCQVQVFHRFDSGTSKAMKVVDQIIEVMQYRTLGPPKIKVRAGSPQHIGRDGMWWQTNITIPFEADDVT